MRRLVGRYRKRPIGPEKDPTIGCVFIRDTTFFAADEPAEPPPGLKPNMLQGGGYDLDDPQFAGYFWELLGRPLGVGGAIDTAGPWQGSGPTYGDPRLTPSGWGSRHSRRWCCAPTPAGAR